MITIFRQFIEPSRKWKNYSLRTICFTSSKERKKNIVNYVSGISLGTRNECRIFYLPLILCHATWSVKLLGKSVQRNSFLIRTASIFITHIIIGKLCRSLLSNNTKLYSFSKITVVVPLWKTINFIWFNEPWILLILTMKKQFLFSKT